MTGIWENEFLSEAAAEMYRLNEDDIIRQQCRAREEYERKEQRAAENRRKIAEYQKELVEQQKQIDQLKAQLAILQEQK